ncbi:cellulose binding domain-containing protein [Streptomyces sp. NPDC007929]|uniref:cellulose binding domain-containing protein n=1 Tax=unclassified Streptomyces TaxID=2593676 RepID=UPI0036F064A7
MHSTQRGPAADRRLWDDEPGPVGIYAQLCTGTAEAARALAALADDEPGTAQRGERSWAEGLPTVPVALNAVLDAARELAASPGGAGLLSPALVRWLEENTPGGPARTAARRSLALRALRRLEPPDAELFWWSCVERLPDQVVARRLRRPQDEVSGDVARVKAEFRERSWQLHRTHVQDPVCRSYAGLLDATARQSAAATPEDLLEHLRQCAVCTEAFDCLSVTNSLLSTLIAEAALGWNGSGYVARRRRHLSEFPGGAVRRPPGSTPAGRRRRPHDKRRAAKTAGIAMSVLLLGCALLTLIDGDQGDQPPLFPDRPGLGITSGPSDPEPGPGPGAGKVRPSPSVTGSAQAPGRDSPAPSASEASPSPSPPADEQPLRERASQSPEPTCTAVLDVRNSWKEGVEGNLRITSQEALDGGWTVTFRVPEGTRTEVWNGEATKEGTLVTVTASAHNQSVPAGATLTIGVVVAFDNGGYPPAAWLSQVHVDGRTCSG